MIMTAYGIVYAAVLSLLAMRIGESAKIGAAISPHNTLCTDMNVLSAPTWTYNWGTTSTFMTLKCNPLPTQEFVPMFWGYSSKTTYSKSDIPAASTHILGYNEPNHAKQSNLTPAEAVEGWKKMQAVFGNLSLISPSAAPCGNNCVYGPPIAWFDEFFNLCNGTCKVDYLATHCYDCNAQNTMNYLNSLSKYGRKIWLTEFACGTGSSHTAQQQLDYMKEIIPMLEQSDLIANYAWFVSRSNNTNSLLNFNNYVNRNESVLTNLGTQYNTY